MAAIFVSAASCSGQLSAVTRGAESGIEVMIVPPRHGVGTSTRRSVSIRYSRVVIRHSMGAEVD